MVTNFGVMKRLQILISFGYAIFGGEGAFEIIKHFLTAV